ncbi:MAG TPA: hypothetical protein VIX17_09645 [Pyrinomonadaceae bacterium]
MSTRGYPVSDFEQRAADVSVDHPFEVGQKNKTPNTPMPRRYGTQPTLTRKLGA